MRQELAGTCVYLEILQKATSGPDTSKDNCQQIRGLQESNTSLTTTVAGTVLHSNADEKLDWVAEEKLVSFCAHVLKEASDFQSSVGDTTTVEIHRVLELRSPVIVKVCSHFGPVNVFCPFHKPPCFCSCVVINVAFFQLVLCLANIIF